MATSAKPSDGHRFPWKWNLADGFPAPGIAFNGLKVFGTFVCGGGSAMGYKLAGCDYLGGVEIDTKIGEVYRRNLQPKYFYNEDIRDFLARDNYPDELRELDILDGSPPCTLFSLDRGKRREDSWGKKKAFKEGQAEQTIDDLVFVWCDLVNKLRPKVALMENVEGLAKGNAKRYLLNVVDRLSGSGYTPQVFVLDAQFMGVPQTRRRCFVIARRNDLNMPPLRLEFSEPIIPFRDIMDPTTEGYCSKFGMAMWKQRRYGDKSLSDVSERTRRRTSRFSVGYVYGHLPSPTLVTLEHYLFDIPRIMNERERERESSHFSGGLRLHRRRHHFPDRHVCAAGYDCSNSARNSNATF